MLVSKYKDKDGNTNVSLLVHTNAIKATKNPLYKRITLKADYEIGLDDKHKIKVKELIDLKKLKDNTVEE
ncbi:MAG: hypothetical protein HUJ68_03570 [Clostridia bacterium]|nr:hypothetical protein [Clostridia bacterium]